MGKTKLHHGKEMRRIVKKVMNLYFVEKFSEGDTDAQLVAMRKVFNLTDLKNADFIYCGSVNKMNQAKGARLDSGKPLATYCWDYYLWAHNGKHHNTANSWIAYAEFLKFCDVIFVPSEAQQLRLKELLNLDSIVCHTGFPTYELPVSDGNFILDPLRYYKADPCWDWAEKAASELNIPIIHTEHGYSQEEFRKLVASCTFMTSCVTEASTGGLTLMEGLWLGKPSLVSNSPYMGAKDYLGPMGYYFQYDNYEDLKKQMLWLWQDRVSYRQVAQKYIKKNFTYDLMAKKLYESLYSYLKEHRIKM